MKDTDNCSLAAWLMDLDAKHLNIFSCIFSVFVRRDVFFSIGVSINAFCMDCCLFYWYLCLLNLLPSRTLSTEFIAYHCHQWPHKSASKLDFEYHLNWNGWFCHLCQLLSKRREKTENSRRKKHFVAHTMLSSTGAHRVRNQVSEQERRKKKCFIDFNSTHNITASEWAHIQFYYVNTVRMHDKREGKKSN